MKTITEIIRPPSPHWVGNGFPVRSLFSYHNRAKQMSPFLLLDYAGPTEFPGGGERRGVGVHPHRGFETVTIVYQGEVEHRDSTGKGGVIGAGDVQWMTAGAGILHEEFHSDDFRRTGGTLQMVQLWVNLPKADKMTAPGYQSISAKEIPQIALPSDAGTLRTIAGSYEGHAGPAHTFSPMHVWDIRLNGGCSVELDLPHGWTTGAIVLQGSAQVAGAQLITEGQMALLSREHSQVSLSAEKDSLILLLSGEPIDEPVVGHGPFVMNSRAEILQAFADLEQGGFGRL